MNIKTRSVVIAWAAAVRATAIPILDPAPMPRSPTRVSPTPPNGGSRTVPDVGRADAPGSRFGPSEAGRFRNDADTRL